MLIDVNVFHPVSTPAPASLSSFYVSSTTTTALLTWKLHGQQSLSTLSLYNTHTQSVTHIFDINSSEAESQYAVKGIQPGTRFKAKVVATTFLKHLDVTLKQRLAIGMETCNVHICFITINKLKLTAGRVESVGKS